MNEYLVGVRLREPVPAAIYKLVGDLVLHVGDVVSVETADAPRSARCGVHGVRCRFPAATGSTAACRSASEEEAREYREQRRREEAPSSPAASSPAARAGAEVVDVEMPTGHRRVTVYFSSEERVDFRDLVRDLAASSARRIEMRQNRRARHHARARRHRPRAGRQLCCSSHLRKF